MGASTSYHAGLSAELMVERLYEQRGYSIAARRFRNRHGEIDLIVQKDGCCVFVEVKKSKTHARAAERLLSSQMARLFDCASVFLAGQPNGQNTDSRFDVALVDANGEIELLENALAA